jgi:hypothetical protein
MLAVNRQGILPIVSLPCSNDNLAFPASLLIHIAENLGNAQAGFNSTSPSFDLTDVAGETPNHGFLDMGVYPNPFSIGDFPMDMGTLTDAVDWVCIYTWVPPHRPTRLIVF